MGPDEIESARIGPQRRPPYGRNPLLAAHGVRARAEIIEAARDLFTRLGYQATTVEAIGEATGRSGAAVYQYFSGKAEIFAVLGREVDVEMGALAQSFPLLTDDAVGSEALRDWIMAMIDLFERHAGTFLSWPQVQFTEPDLVSIGQASFQRYQAGMVDRLARADVRPPNPGIAPVGIMCVIARSTLLNAARRTEPVDRGALAVALTRMLHAYLFAPPATAWDPDGAYPADIKLPSIPLGDALGLRRPVTPRGVGTVQRILLAAAEGFRLNGYHGTSLNDIAARAGVSHGSVYTYWADREALFATLANDALAAVQVQQQRLPGPEATGDAIDRWVEGWVSMLDVHGSVLYVWQHEVAFAAGLDELTARRDATLDGMVAGLLSLAPEPPTDPEPTRVAIRAVLTDVPYVLSTQLGILPRAASCRFVADLLRAGLDVARSGS